MNSWSLEHVVEHDVYYSKNDMFNESISCLSISTGITRICRWIKWMPSSVSVDRQKTNLVDRIYHKVVEFFVDSAIAASSEGTLKG